MPAIYTENEHVRLITGGPDMVVERIFHDGWVVCRWLRQGETKTSAFDVTKLEPIIETRHHGVGRLRASS
jgi:uncharacterized protein YodC (DUF2158 family)